MIIFVAESILTYKGRKINRGKIEVIYG